MLRCSKEAFERCTDHCKCGSIEDAVYVEGSECDRFNQYVLTTPPPQRPASERGQSTPVTNADRIRAMNDEELAKVPTKWSGYSCVFPDRECGDGQTCEKCLLEWLQQPAEGTKWTKLSCGSKA